MLRIFEKLSMSLAKDRRHRRARCIGGMKFGAVLERYMIKYVTRL